MGDIYGAKNVVLVEICGVLNKPKKSLIAHGYLFIGILLSF